MRRHRTHLLLVSAVVACGTDRRAAFEPAPDASPSPANAGDGGAFPNAPASSCDDAALAAARSLAGCRFIAPEIGWSGSSHPDIAVGGCHPLLVTNPTSQPAHLRLRYEDREEDAAPYASTATFEGLGATYAPLQGGVLRPGETAVVSTIFAPRAPSDRLPESSLCPTKAFLESNTPVVLLGAATDAIELLSDVPVLAVHVLRYQLSPRPDGVAGAFTETSAYPLFPVHLFAKSVIETGIFKPGLPSTITLTDENGPTVLPVAPIRRVVVGAFDDTHVTVSLADGSTRAIVLQRGNVWADDANDAFVGHSVTADRPVTVISGSVESFIRWDFPVQPAPDANRVFSASLPEAVWASEYVAVRHRDRWEGISEQPPWRIIGATDGTKLSYEPSRPEGAPEAIQRGQLAIFVADSAFVIRSQDAAHPFYVGAHMTGANYQKQRSGFAGTGTEDLRGGAESLHVLPASRWVDRYSFFVLPAYPNANLVVIRKRDSGDVRLDCAGTLAGWQPVGASYEFTRVALTGPLFDPIGTCQAGPHQIESDAPFAATLWAWGDHETGAALGIGDSAGYALPLFGIDAAMQPTAH